MPVEHAVTTIRRFFEALERHDLEEAMRYTGEGFSVQVAGGYPLGFKDYCRAQTALWTAFPDLRYDVRDVKQSLSLGSASVQLSGTFRDDLALPFANLPIFPATGERIELPRERLGFTLEWGEILTVRTESSTGYGLLGPLYTVGAVLPPPGIMG